MRVCTCVFLKSLNDVYIFVCLRAFPCLLAVGNVFMIGVRSVRSVFNCIVVLCLSFVFVRLLLVL